MTRLRRSGRNSTPTDADADADDPVQAHHSTAAWRRRIVLGVLPALALLLAAGAGYLKWQSAVTSESVYARTESIQAATETTIAMLSYKPHTAEKDLVAAQDRLTGQFRDAYGTLIHDVVVPAAGQKGVSAVATVPAAASVTATAKHAVVIVFIDQTTTIGGDPPTTTASSVRVTLDKIGGRWLVSDFTPL